MESFLSLGILMILENILEYFRTSYDKFKEIFEYLLLVMSSIRFRFQVLETPKVIKHEILKRF